MVTRDSLLKNVDVLTNNLTDLESICTILITHDVLSSGDVAEILSNRTNAGRISSLIAFIYCRFERAFPWFCYGLKQTKQLHLLPLPDPHGIQCIPAQSPSLVEPEISSNECEICFEFTRILSL